MRREPENVKAVLRDVRDGVVLVEYPGASEEEANRAAVALAHRLSAKGERGILDAVPAARTLLVLYDAAHLSRGMLAEEIERLGTRPSDAGLTRRLFRIPVVYGGAHGRDLADLARGIGLSADDFAKRHAAAEYRVAFIGFSPGFPYLVGLPEELRAPRLSSPRPRVPAGSVAIGGPYSGVYPAVTPGGWRLIGRSHVRLFDPEADPPALLGAGDRVRFEAISPEALNEASGHEPAAVGGRPIFRLLSPGVFTSVQGGPRHGLGSSGVPAGGAMDTGALAQANGLVGNAAGDPALEVALVGPELEALEGATVAIVGGDLAAEWNGRPAPFGEAFAMAACDRLRFGSARRGARAYLAVRGGLECPRLTHRLEAGEEVAVGGRPSGVQAGVPGSAEWRAGDVLRVILGPQSDHFQAAAIDQFLASCWRVSPMSDRRGLRLEGERLEHIRACEIPPEGTVPGSIQVPGEGLPIVLGPDGPVTGGYPKIATIIGPDLPLLGQATPGAILRFSAVSRAEALGARREYH